MGAGQWGGGLRKKGLSWFRAPLRNAFGRIFEKWQSGRFLLHFGQAPFSNPNEIRIRFTSNKSALQASANHWDCPTPAKGIENQISLVGAGFNQPFHQFFRLLYGVQKLA